jgi:hypothetical protein
MLTSHKLNKKILFLQQLISLCLIGLPELYAKNIMEVLNIDNVVEIQKCQIIQGNKQYL